MYSIQQESLFSLEKLLELSPKDTFGYLFETFHPVLLKQTTCMKCNKLLKVSFNCDKSS